MGLWDIIVNIVAVNVGMTIENILVILLGLGSLIFMANNFQVGSLISFIMSGLAFMVAYNYGLNYVPFLAMFFIFLVITTLKRLKSL